MKEIQDYIRKMAAKYNVPVSEIHLNLNELNGEHLTIWRYSHKPSSEFINILELSWEHLETKKIRQ